MKALETAKSEFQMRRMDESMRRAEGAQIKGDFDGSVAASWRRLDDGGAGIAVYKGREYPVRTIGFTSIPKGTTVELTYADGTYFAKI